MWGWWMEYAYFVCFLGAIKDGSDGCMSSMMLRGSEAQY